MTKQEEKNKRWYYYLIVDKDNIISDLLKGCKVVVVKNGGHCSAWIKKEDKNNVTVTVTKGFCLEKYDLKTFLKLFKKAY